MITTTLRHHSIQILLSLLVLGITGITFAQAPEAAQREPLRVIDMPTAGINHRSEFNSDLRIYPEGGIQLQMGIGLFRRFMMGLSYGGTNVVGRGNVEGNKQPGVLVKYRLWEETEAFPAIVGGYDNQGAGRWSDSLNRFEYKSPGLFIVASKNFGFGGDKNLGLHAMVNWNSTETEDDRGMSGSLGCDVSLNEELVLLMEYNAAQDDFKKVNGNYLSLGRGRGYLNGGVRWAIGKIYLQFEFKDLMGNRVNNPGGADRAFTISYAEDIKW
ncbi:MAG: YjbH domain-containing protein [bacterium]|nr:YjbH domain-containing protein [bacterium]